MQFDCQSFSSFFKTNQGQSIVLKYRIKASDRNTNKTEITKIETCTEQHTKKIETKQKLERNKKQSVKMIDKILKIRQGKQKLSMKFLKSRTEQK